MGSCQRARKERRNRPPTIDPDYDNFRNSMVEAIEIKFHIDNSPAIYYTGGGIDSFAYVDCEEARQSDEMTNPYVDGEQFKQEAT